MNEQEVTVVASDQVVMIGIVGAAAILLIWLVIEKKL